MLVAVGDFAMPVAPSHGPGWSVAAPCPWRPAPIQARAPGLRTGAPSGCGLLRRGVLDTHGAQRPLQDDREVAAEPHPLRVVGPGPELEVGGRLTESHEQRLRRGGSLLTLGSRRARSVSRVMIRAGSVSPVTPTSSSIRRRRSDSVQLVTLS